MAKNLKICNMGFDIDVPGIFEGLHGKRIFITGGTGFFGKWLLYFFDFLRREFSINCKVTVLSRSPEKFLKSNSGFKNMKKLAFTAGDIRDFAFPEKSFDFVIHAAATVTVPGLASDEEYMTVFDGTRQVLQMCKSKKIKRLLYISSGAVYGVQPPEMAGVSEIFPCNPVNEYGRGKRDAENLCLGSGIDTVIARCFAFVGPHLPLDKHFAIGNFINNVLKGEDIYIKGDGTPYRSYMYASDLVEWLLTILLKGKSGEAYNVGSGKEISIRELAEKVASFSEGKSKVVIARKPENGVLPSRYIPDVNKAVNQLNLRCKVPLETAISETVKWNKTGEGK